MEKKCGKILLTVKNACPILQIDVNQSNMQLEGLTASSVKKHQASFSTFRTLRSSIRET